MHELPDENIEEKIRPSMTHVSGVVGRDSADIEGYTTV